MQPIKFIDRINFHPVELPLCMENLISIPVDTGRILNVHKKFKRGPGRTPYVRSRQTSYVRSVSTAILLFVRNKKPKLGA